MGIGTHVSLTQYVPIARATIKIPLVKNLGFEVIQDNDL